MASLTNERQSDFAITDAAAYLDSLKLYCWRRFPRDVFNTLRKQYRERLLVDDLSRHGLSLGEAKWLNRWMITLHQPDQATLCLLKEMQRGRFAISEVHIATDFLCPTVQEADRVQSFLKAGLVQRWRRQGQETHVEISTAYGNRNKRAKRNSALYAVRPSKTGRGPCCHFELRFVSAQACKRAGLSSFDVLTGGLDTLPLLQHEARIVFIKIRAVERVAEEFSRRSKRRHPNLSVAHIKIRLLHLLARRVADDQFDPINDPISTARAQAFYDLGKCWRTCLGKGLDWATFPQPRWHHWSTPDVTLNIFANPRQRH